LHPSRWSALMSTPSRGPDADAMAA
jgi:hypothetical protein